MKMAKKACFEDRKRPLNCPASPPEPTSTYAYLTSKSALRCGCWRLERRFRDYAPSSGPDDPGVIAKTEGKMGVEMVKKSVDFELVHRFVHIFWPTNKAAQYLLFALGHTRTT